jgi:hypothetical protein
VAGLIEGETVGIHFSVPLEAGDQHFWLEGEIVRVMDSGVGIRFPHNMASDALDTYSNKTPPEAASSSQPKGLEKREG